MWATPLPLMCPKPSFARTARRIARRCATTLRHNARCAHARAQCCPRAAACRAAPMLRPCCALCCARAAAPRYARAAPALCQLRAS